MNVSVINYERKCEIINVVLVGIINVIVTFSKYLDGPNTLPRTFSQARAPCTQPGDFDR